MSVVVAVSAGSLLLKTIQSEDDSKPVLVLVAFATAACLPLNVVQSVLERSPAVTLATEDIGILRVCVLVAELKAGEFPVVPMAKV